MIHQIKRKIKKIEIYEIYNFQLFSKIVYKICVFNFKK